MDFLKDNIWKLMLRLSVPGIMGMLIISLSSFADAVIVGRLISPGAFAGISLILPLNVFTSAVIGLIAAGSASVLSRAIGAGNKEKQSQMLSTVLSLSLSASIPMTAITWFFSGELVKLMGGKNMLLQYGSDYYATLVLGTFFFVFALTSSSLIRSEGRIKQAMTYSGMVVALNILLSLTFIVYFEMGVKGVALGTNLSMVFYCILNLSYFFSGKASFQIGKLQLIWNRGLIKEIFSVGMSAFIMQVMSFLRQVMLFKSVSWYGTVHDLTFFSAVFRVFTFSLIPAFGMLQSMQPVLGINYGAGKYRRSVQVINIFRRGGFLLLFVIASASILFPSHIIGLMLPGISFTENEILSFRLLMAILPFFPLASTGIIFFQATGSGTLASYLSFSRELLIFIPLVIVLPQWYGLQGVYYTILIDNMLYILLIYAFSYYKIHKLKSYETSTAQRDLSEVRL